MIQRISKAGTAQLRRLAKAAHIARKGGMVQADGAWVVTSDTGHTYAINGACQCADYRRGAARNGGWCKHRLAVWLVTELAKGEKLPALYAGAVERIVEKHPVSGVNADGASTKDTSTCHCHYTTEQILALERRGWGGCWRYYQGCTCPKCEAAERLQNATLAPKCSVCGDRLAAHDAAADDGLCWRCAEEQDYAADQAMYDDLRHGG